MKTPFMTLLQDPTKSAPEEFFNSIAVPKTNFFTINVFDTPPEELYFHLGKEQLKQHFDAEFQQNKPHIIFIFDSWMKRLIERYYLFELITGINKKELAGHECYIVVWDISQTEEIKRLIDSILIDWKFVHLHCHNSLSLKDGVGTPETRIRWHADNQKPAIATTNHGNISDWIKIYEGAKKNNMLPILGIEAYINRYAGEFEKALQEDTKENIQVRKQLKKFNRHLTLLAKDLDGFYNIIKIHNDGWVNRFYRFPLCSPKFIQQHSKGIICLSGCSIGEQNRIISDKIYLQTDARAKEIEILIENKIKSMTTLFNTRNDTRASKDDYLDDFDLKYFYDHNADKKLDKDDYQKYVLNIIKKSDQRKIETADIQVREIIDWWHKIFGDDYYLEIMLIDYDMQKYINQELVKISKEKNIPLVITNDCHYLVKKDADIQVLQMLSDQEKTFDDLAKDQETGANKIWTIKSRELYYKSVSELREAWEQWHKSDIFTEEVFWQAINNTISIIDKIKSFELDKTVKLPKLYSESQKILVQKVIDGMKRLNLYNKKEYQERIQYELSVIIEKGFIDYFLVIEDLIGWIKSKYGELAIGAGRGSAAGSLVNYVLGLTYVDPIRHNLLFERFLDPSREDLPDIDQDVQPRIRDAVIQYLIDKYGSECVATIGTFGMLKLRSAILDAARVCGIPVSETMPMTTKLPVGLDEKASLEQLEEEYSFLKEYMDNHDSEEIPLRKYVSSIRGTQRQAGTHAAGVLISSNKLFDNIPLIRSKKTIVTGWIDGEDGRELSGLNYSKMDILGLKNLEVIEDAIKLIKERQNIDIDISSIDIDDRNVFEQTIKKCDNYGIFQFECIDEETIINGKTIKERYESNDFAHILSWDGEKLIENECLAIKKCEEKEVFEIVLENGKIISCSENHEVMTDNGWKYVKDLTIDDSLLCDE